MPLLAAVLAWAIGVLVNHLADVLPRAGSLGRPHCLACIGPRPLVAWSALLAALSRRPHCEYCGTLRGARPVLVEITALAGGLGLWLWHPEVGRWLAALVLLAWFLVIGVIDLEHRLIPHRATIPAALMIGVIGWLDPARGAVKTLSGGAAGLLLFFLLYLLGGAFARLASRLRGRPLEEIAFGFGDVTLAGVIGLAVGWPGVIVALFLGIFAAGAFSLGYLLLMLARRRYSAFAAIPYGPFMILGAFLVYFGGRTALERLLGG
ncbi:MAG: A24 family peptidase [Chloroflexota bacterium]